MNDYKKMRKRALMCDIISLVVALVVLFFGSRDELQEWVLIVGLIVAVIFLIAAVVLSIKARKLERRAFAAENRRLEELAQRGLTQDEVEDFGDPQEEPVAEVAVSAVEEKAEEAVEETPEEKEG
jgi:choline-glycine betaine transporter